MGTTCLKKVSSDNQTQKQNSIDRYIIKQEEKKVIINQASETNIINCDIKNQNNTESQNNTINLIPIKEISSDLYFQALSSQRVRSFNILMHHYFQKTTSSSSSSTNQNKLKRLNNEIKILSQNLPINITNPIFLTYDEQRIDVMKSLIFGASGTPYAHGAFIYDIYFDDIYPSAPPKVNLMTTGGNKFRFNPNLYQNGYVCLSLLGTWSGSGNEAWNPTNSNILQVLLSIQSLVMNNDIFFNEPGYEFQKNTTSGIKANLAYQNIVKYANLKFAINNILENPPTEFADIIKVNFYLKQEVIQKEIEEWIQLAKDESIQTIQPDYNMVGSIFCEQFIKGQFFTLLTEEYEKFKSLIQNINVNEVNQLISSFKSN